MQKSPRDTLLTVCYEIFEMKFSKSFRIEIFENFWKNAAALKFSKV